MGDKLPSKRPKPSWSIYVVLPYYMTLRIMYFSKHFIIFNNNMGIAIISNQQIDNWIHK